MAEVLQINGYVSPRLGVWFELSGQGVRILRPDGQPLLSYEELARREERKSRLVEQAQQKAEQERLRAEQERERADRAAAELEQLRRELNARGRAQQS